MKLLPAFTGTLVDIAVYILCIYIYLYIPQDKYILLHISSGTIIYDLAKILFVFLSDCLSENLIQTNEIKTCYLHQQAVIKPISMHIYICLRLLAHHREVTTKYYKKESENHSTFCVH